MSDLPVGLADDFGSRGLEVGLPVRRVSVLVRIKVKLGIRVVNFLAAPKCAVRSFAGVSQNQFGSESSEYLLTFPRCIGRQAQTDLVTLRGANHRIRNPGIAAR